MDNEIQDIIRQLRELTARLEALLAQEKPAANPQPEPEPESEPEPTINFSLNDRYRFMRELFGGSSAAMQQAVAHIQSLKSEAETIVYIQSLDWDVNDQVVKDFIAAVTERFKATPTLLA